MTFVCPLLSNASRSAPMRPSIMSEGPMISAPLRPATGLVSPRPRPFHHSGFCHPPQIHRVRRYYRVQRHICHDRDIRNRRLDRAGCSVGQVVWVPCLGTVFGFLGRIGVGEQTDRGNAQIGRLFRGVYQFINAAAHHPGIEDTGCSTPSPSQINTGQIKSSTLTRFSRIRARVCATDGHGEIVFWGMRLVHWGSWVAPAYLLQNCTKTQRTTRC